MSTRAYVNAVVAVMTSKIMSVGNLVAHGLTCHNAT